MAWGYAILQIVERERLVEQVVAALVDRSALNVSGEELDRMSALIEKARKDGR